MKIAMYKGIGLLSDIVLHFSRGKYSHTAIVLNDGSVIEAMEFHGVRRRKSVTDQLDSNYKIDIFNVATTPEQDEIIESFLVKQLGKKYDYLSVAGFVLFTTHEARESVGKWICSELVMAAFKEAGVNLLERVEEWQVSPVILSYNTIMTYEKTLHYVI